MTMIIGTITVYVVTVVVVLFTALVIIEIGKLVLHGRMPVSKSILAAFIYAYNIFTAIFFLMRINS